ncbi:NAD(P)/FAD-dependent oxidoreductase [Streptomyces sp. NPDC048057]|uniref:FAD/NAD(P)-dependent oxidoreductase n=1 Tax=Streptomyces sp. NPDC048057 TaxID=3155628 RepID=UPI00340A6AC1
MTADARRDATTRRTSHGDGWDLAVVGAGPAGLTAALTAADHGLAVVLIDAAPRPGGQYHRLPHPALATAPADRGRSAFGVQRRRLDAHRRSGRITYLPDRQVWSVQRTQPPGWALRTTATDGHRTAEDATVPARGLLLATGAYERQLPFPGWTLPGVIGAGGAQAMLKAGRVLPGRRVVVAGSGPLLLAVAATLVDAGARVPALVEAGDVRRYAREPRALVAGLAKSGEALRLGATLLRHGVTLHTRTAVTAAHGDARVEAVTLARLDAAWRPVPGSERTVPCDAVAVGHGLVPQLDLAGQVGCATRSAPDGTAALVVDAAQRTSVPRVWAAGEPTGTGGADLARHEGELAALAAALDLGARPRTAGTPTALLRRRRALRRFADAMARVHRPGAGWTHWLSDTTDVCRCEEVTAGTVRTAVREHGAADPRTVKLLTRAGMGWCQGRMCSPAVACLAAGGDGAAPLPHTRRPLAFPVSLEDLAALPPAPADALDAVAERPPGPTPPA